MTTPTPQNPLPQLRQLNRLILIGFAAILFTLLFWVIIRGPTILAREDNPRLFQAEQQIARGVILDRHGDVLASSHLENGIQVRQYAQAGPAVGYYSLRHGTAGVEESFDAVLRGTPETELNALRQQLLHLPQVGQGVQLTLDTAVQYQADTLLGSHTGAILLLTLPNAEILALASHPGYDPNQLDAQFDDLIAAESAPLLNRVTQGQYQPGRILLPFLLAEGIDSSAVTLTETVTTPNQPVAIGDVLLQCDARPPENTTWVDVLHLHCPYPVTQLGAALGAEQIGAWLAAFGFTQQPPLPITLPDPVPLVIADVGLAALGQETLTVTPLQVALALAALGNGGVMPLPQLVTAVQSPDGSWNPYTPSGQALPPAISATAATRLRRVLPQHETISEYAVLVLAGPEGVNNAWYLALAPANAPTHALVVVLEGQTAVTNATTIGRQLLLNLPSP